MNRSTTGAAVIGRWPVLAGVAVVATILGVAHLSGLGWNASWRLLGVSAMDPPFADLRTVTHSLDCVRHGIDPYVDARCDPWRRTYNYPRIWLWLAGLGLGSGQTMVLGTLFALALAAAFLRIFSVRTALGGVLVLLIVISPPVMLAVERGNIDIAIFVLLVLGLTLSAGLSARAQTGARAVLVVLLTVLKAFPVAGVAVLARDRRTLLPAVITGALALLALWLTLHPGDLTRIAANTPQTPGGAFGALPLFQAYVALPLATLRPLASGLALLVAVLAAALAATGRFRLETLPQLRAGVFRDDLALACLAIHGLAFLLGANADYRLLFLCGTVPALLVAYEAQQPRRGLAPIALIVAFLWLSAPSSHIGYADELLDWVLFIGAAGWFGRTARERLG